MKKKKRGGTTAKRCIGFDTNAPRKRRSKRLKSLTVDLATMEEDGDGLTGEKEGDHIVDKLPNVGENLDSTPTSPRSYLPSDSSESRVRRVIQKLTSEVSPILEGSQDVGDNMNVCESIMENLPKTCRGPTKMKSFAIEECSKVDITFNEYGQPIGEASVEMASFLGSLVREVVPVTLNDWRKLPTRLKEILWSSIQSRYNVNENWQRTFIFQKMGRLWRAGKSRIVSQIQNANDDEELVKIKPANIPSIHDWMDFVKEKKSARFKAKSEKFKHMKKKQLPHTCSRKGYARLAEEMKKSCSNSSSVTRVALWAKAHMKKDGNPINSRVAETLERIKQIDGEATNTANNVANDAIREVFGPNRGHIKGLGFGVAFSKLSSLSQKDNYAKLEEKYKKMEGEMSEMKSMMSQILGNVSEQLSNATKEHMVNNVATNILVSSPLSINNNNALRKCKLLDWCGTGEVVAEGRWSSNDPKVMVHCVPLGPHAVRVWVDLPKKPDAFLWRPNLEMTYIEDAVGSTIAWPLDKVMIG